MDTLAALKQASAGTGLLSVPHRDVIAGSSPIIRHDISDLIAPVNEESDDFLVVDYKLQVALNTSIIDNLSVKAIANPNLSVPFDRISRGLQVLESWVPLSSLSGSNTVENVCERGFNLNDFALGFPVDVGSIKIDSFQGMNITYVLCKIVVGNSIVVEDVDEGKFYVNAIRSKGFDHSGDSLYVKTDQSDMYRNRYRLFNPSQILPCYIVQFATSSLVRRPPVSSVKYSDGTYDPVTSPLVKESVQQHIREINKILKHEFADTAEDCVYDVTEKSMMFLQELAQEKMSVILSEEMLMRHQIQQMKYLREFVSNQYKAMNPEEFCTFIAASNALLTTGAAYGRRRPKTLDTVIPDLCVKGGVNISNNWENLQPRGGGCIAHSSIYGFVSDKPPAIEYGSTSSHLMLEGKSPTRNETVRQPAIALRKHLSTVLKSTVFREAVYEEHIGQYLAAAEKEVDENNKKTKALSMRSIDSKIMAVKKALDEGKYEEVLQSNVKKAAASTVNDAAKDGADEESKETAEEKDDQPAVTAIPVDQSILAMRAGSYAVEPDALKSYQRQDNVQKSHGMAIVDYLWANSLRGERIVVRESESESDESEEESTDEDEANAQSPVEHKKKEIDDREGWTASQDTNVFRRCRTVAKRFNQRSLGFEAQRTKRRFVAQTERDGSNEAPPETPFRRSKLIPEHQQDNLFWCLPPVGSDRFCSVKYVGALHGRRHNVMNLHKLLRDSDSKSSLIVFKSGDYVFGAYAPVIIPDDGEYSGTRDAFLFSLTHNLKFPYHGRRHPKGWKGRNAGDAVHGEEDIVSFGVKDLIIPEDMLRCTSSLENSYGFGMPRDVTETFLAGRHVFSIDEVEIWRVGRAFEVALVESFEDQVTPAPVEQFSDESSLSSFDSGSSFTDETFSTSTGFTGSKTNSLSMPGSSVGKMSSGKGAERPLPHHTKDPRKQHQKKKKKLRRGTNSLSMARMAIDANKSTGPPPPAPSNKPVERAPPRFSVLERQLLDSMNGLDKAAPPPAFAPPPPDDIPPPPRFSSIFKEAPPPPRGGMGGAPPPPAHAPPPSAFAPPPPAHAPPPSKPVKKAAPVPSMFMSLPPPPPAPVLVGSHKGQQPNEPYIGGLRSSLNASFKMGHAPPSIGVPPPPPAF